LLAEGLSDNEEAGLTLEMSNEVMKKEFLSLEKGKLMSLFTCKRIAHQVGHRAFWR